jgi:hypothetical protein
LLLILKIKAVTIIFQFNGNQWPGDWSRPNLTKTLNMINIPQTVDSIQYSYGVMNEPLSHTFRKSFVFSVILNPREPLKGTLQGLGAIYE